MLLLRIMCALVIIFIQLRFLKSSSIDVASPIQTFWLKILFPIRLEEWPMVWILRGVKGYCKATFEAEWNLGSSDFAVGRKSEDFCEKVSSCRKVLSSQRTQVRSKGEQITFCHLNQLPDRLLMNLYSVRPVETSYGALENKYDQFSIPIFSSLSSTSQGLSCEGCQMTLHKWCYINVVNPCKKTV